MSPRVKAQTTGGTVTGYQWRKNGIPLPGETNANLFVNAAHPFASGTYSVTVTNILQAVASATARIQVDAETHRALPLQLTGWNWDHVTENAAPTHSRPFLFGGGSPSMFEAGLNGHADGLPASRRITSAVNAGVLFELQPYKQQNVLLLSSSNRAETLELEAPASFANLHVLAASGAGSGDGTLTINFVDGSVSDPIRFNARDYFGGTNAYSTTYRTRRAAISGLGRNTTAGDRFTYQGGTYGFEYHHTGIDLTERGLNQKPIKSLTFTKPTGSPEVMFIWAVSGEVGVPFVKIPGRIDPNFFATIDHGSVNAISLQPDGTAYIGGSFLRVNGVVQPLLAKLNHDGTIDPQFNPGVFNGNSVLAISPSAIGTGSVLVGGYFQGIGDTFARNLVRLTVTGEIDPSFQAWPNDAVYRLIPLAQGRTLVCGGFSSIFQSGTVIYHNGVVIVGSDGSIIGGDAGMDATITAAVVAPDGKFIIGGRFRTPDGILRKGVARLTAAARFDSTFKTVAMVSEAGTPINSLALDEQGRILVVGNFLAVNGVPRQNVCRLDPDGSLDLSFAADTPGIAFNVVPQPGGRIFIGAEPPSLRTVKTLSQSLVNEAGSIVPCFESSWASMVRQASVRADGAALLGGYFGHHQLVKTYLQAENLNLFWPGKDADGFHFCCAGIEGKNYILESKTVLDAGDWEEVGAFTGTGATERISGELTHPNRNFYRVRER